MPQGLRRKSAGQRLSGEAVTVNVKYKETARGGLAVNVVEC
ncbi:hypothetical protein RM844_09695 [Streptomyces sp. DSM 44915]|uniref:Uncharacterized protein n=1 Tax=Streptomyces chisholmiae TaxID=3075540 RepID=A0ABU2JNK2_9ACTN|nr:hypothetical protein [Streptomyces sp. DSM 44915]MDT0266566.1 hypothetical protein [Streptomyces sp. DSM 44915]